MRKYLTNFRWFVFCLLILSLTAAAVSLTNLRSQILAIGDGAVTGPIWFVTGIERDLHEFELSIANYERNIVQAETVNLRFDILWSRVNGATESDVAIKLREYDLDASIFEVIMSMLKEHEDTVVHIAMATPLGRRAMIDDFRMMSARIHKFSLEVLQATSFETRTWRIALLTISSKNALISVMITCVVFLLLISLFLDSLDARRRLKEKDVLLKGAEAANVAKSRFLSVVNHELRTPLTSINGVVSLISAGALGEVPENFRRPIKIAERNCNQLNALIVDLLDVEKFTAEKIEYHFNDVALQSFLHEQIEMNTSYANIYGIELVAESNMPELKVQVDRHRLAQVLSNLISNAAKFSEEGSKVVIGLEQVGDRAVVSVKDTGRGIPEEARGRIFDRFQQVDSSNERERGGTGLGLAIIRSIVEAHGGKIDFDSVVGQGTTFHFDLSLTP